VPKDRKQDRHALPTRVIRPNPAELWEKLGEKAGKGKRSEVVSRLIQGYLDGDIHLNDETPPA
jgi:hypothetical protein